MGRKQVYIHILVITAGFGFLGYWLKVPMLYLLAAMVAASMIHFKLASFIAKAWLFAGEKLGYVNGIFLLSLLYFFLLWPLSLLKKLFQAIPAGQLRSTWQHATPLSDFKRPF